MARLNSKLESEGAEFLVLGNLLIEGLHAFKAYENQRGYDLIATLPDTSRSARIQVKSRWATDAGHFIISKFESDFVVLVRLNRGGRYSRKTAKEPTEPEFYVLSAAEAKSMADARGWGKIVWRPGVLAPHRRSWTKIRIFLTERAEA